MSEFIHNISSARCYACDAGSVGVATHNGETKSACRRHADPSMKAGRVCYVCNGHLRAGSSHDAHVKCLRGE